MPPVCAVLMNRPRSCLWNAGPICPSPIAGLPYHTSGIIAREQDLLVANEAYFKANLNIDARTNCEAVAVDAKARTVDLRDVETGEVTTHRLRQTCPVAWRTLDHAADFGDRPARYLPDAHRARCARGAGMDREGIAVSCRDEQVFRFPDRAAQNTGGCRGRRVHRARDGRESRSSRFRRDGDRASGSDPCARWTVKWRRSSKATSSITGSRSCLAMRSHASTRPKTARSTSTTRSGAVLPADIVILALGVRPDTTLAKLAGLEIGELGGIRVDDRMQTSDPDILAVGDASRCATPSLAHGA